MNISIFGCGSIGRRHILNLLDRAEAFEIEEVRAYDLNPERRRAVRDELTDSRLVVCDHIEDALGGTELAFICTPTASHQSIWNQIKNLSDCHFYIEKPLSHKLDGCEEFIFEMERCNRLVIVGYMLRSHPVIQFVKNHLLSTDGMGEIIYADAECGVYLPQWHPWEDYRDFYMSWKSGGGGALLDISHEIDFLQYLIGDITSVSGTFATISDLEITSDDYAAAQVQFASRAMGRIQLDLLQFRRKREFRLFSNNEQITADLVANQVTSVKRDGQTKTLFECNELNFNDVYINNYKELFRTIKDGAYSAKTCSGREAMRVMNVIEGVRLSSATGSRIGLPLY